MQRKRCACCQKFFTLRPQTPQQKFCSADTCQKERRRRWQQDKLRCDPHYRENQARVNAQWHERNPDYWQDYRQRHPEYVERNRARQRERDAKRREVLLAKMDVSTRASPIPAGLYRLSPGTSADLAKMDAWMVRITPVARREAPSG